MYFFTTAGPDTGDPFSPVAFAVTLPLGEIQQTIMKVQQDAQMDQPVTGCFSFMEDLTLAVPTAVATQTKNIAEKALAEVGLRFNMLECMVYTPSRVCPPGMEDQWHQAKRHSS